MTDKKPEIRACEKHGEYEVKTVRVLNVDIRASGCPKCNAEENAQEEAERQERESAENSARSKQARIDAGISKRYLGVDLEAYKPLNQAQNNAREAAKSLISAILSKKTCHSIIFTGGVGTGKTMLCSAIIEELIRYRTCKLIKCFDLVRQLKSTWRRDSPIGEDELIQHFADLDLLIIDEIGVQFGSDTERLFIYDVIDRRYEAMLPTVLVSNNDIDEIRELVGERVIDRLRAGGGKLIVMDGESQRR